FKQRIAHGLLGGVLMAGFARSGRLFDDVSFDEQNFIFLKGVHVGDRVRVQTRVGKDVRKGDRRVRILYSALEKKTGEKWERVIQGESILTVKDRAMIGEGKTAIVVDDQYLVAAGTELVLRHHGFQTHLAGNGQEALELIARMKAEGRQVDLVVTDKDMPEMGGEELVIRLKAEHPGMPVLMNTGDTTHLTALRARLEIPILAKPFSMNEMLAAITKILGDQALTATEAVGGIDLNPTDMDFQIKRDPTGIPLPVELQPVEFMHIEGFVPVILEISPVHSLPMLLGVLDGDAQKSTPYPGPLQPLAQDANRNSRFAGAPKT
ncbi:MAG: response regulator, partial [Candidatus Omnitrophica bacterium]|nr:response regulator [Candidatus Omnitrophota bacterium]